MYLGRLFSLFIRHVSRGCRRPGRSRCRSGNRALGPGGADVPGLGMSAISEASPRSDWNRRIRALSRFLVAGGCFESGVFMMGALLTLAVSTASLGSRSKTDSKEAQHETQQDSDLRARSIFCPRPSRSSGATSDLPRSGDWRRQIAALE